MPVSFDGKRVVIRVAYNRAMIEKIKSIPGRRWDAASRWWTLPLEFLPKLRELLPGLVYDATPDQTVSAPARTVHARGLCCARGSVPCQLQVLETRRDADDTPAKRPGRCGPRRTAWGRPPTTPTRVACPSSTQGFVTLK